MKAALNAIRKAVIAAGSALLAGAVGVVTEDSFHVASVSYGQVSSVLFVALTAGVATFAIPNKAKPIVAAVEHKIADAGAAAFTVDLQPHLATLQADLAAAIAPLPAGAHAAPPTT